MDVVFAFFFCPSSAALLFGSLVPLSIKCESSWLLPSMYGASTALLAIIFAVSLAVGAKAVGTAFNSIRVFERWARRVTGVIFVGIGIYFSLRFIFHVF